ncbi:MAG: class I SAM-dependent methyltransferase [Candidatus Hydrogenedentota bacterium]|nr:MAG: class I SAM-dependent methyltransferase [Candidatus Hydrogenedentota bacterium]
MADDLYEGFAERYDFFLGKFGEHEPEHAGFFRRLFAENQVRSVLDCACGTGRDLHLFHSLGCEVFGADISDSMLAQALKNLTECGLKTPLEKADYRELPQHFTRRFDAVVCLSGSILHMHDEGEVRRAFKSMREVLSDNGILVLTQRTTDKLWKEKPRFILSVNTKTFSRVVAIDYFDRGARYNILDIFHSKEARDLKVWSVDYPRIWLKGDQERLLRASGFETVDFYGTYRLDPYDKEMSDLLIAVAHKSREQ